LPDGSFTVSNTVYSWAWRGLAASSEMASGRADAIADGFAYHFHGHIGAIVADIGFDEANIGISRLTEGNDLSTALLRLAP